VPLNKMDDTPAVYECNALLFMHFPKGGSMTTCIAVSVAPAPGNRENLFECRYRTRLFALRIGDLETRKATGQIIEGRGSGKMRVIMV